MASGLGTATIDFGATPATEATVDVTGQAGITSACAVRARVTDRSRWLQEPASHAAARPGLCADPGQQPAPGKAQCRTASFNWWPVNYLAADLHPAY